jgi:glyoxylase-like metal-dependent hydrolase (beta-lactamase superfamily II)
MEHEPEIIRHPHGISTIDAEYVRPGFAAVHIIQRDGKAAIVDTGTNSSVPAILRALQQLGVQASSVDAVFLTHVHLDHAGGAGLLMQNLPGARAVVHPRGVPHLVDPSRLAEATAAVYGRERFEQLYGRLVPIPKTRIVETRDLDGLLLGNSRLSILHTPGHALHHQALFDREASAVFSGDTFGVSYRELDGQDGRAFIVPTTTPTQFDPDQLLESIERLDQLGAEAFYLTHFGRVTDVARLTRSLLEQVKKFVEIALRHRASPDRHERIRAEMRDLWLELWRGQGGGSGPERLLAVLGADLELNTQGLVAWLARNERRPEGTTGPG